MFQNLFRSHLDAIGNFDTQQIERLSMSSSSNKMNIGLVCLVVGLATALACVLIVKPKSQPGPTTDGTSTTTTVTTDPGGIEQPKSEQKEEVVVEHRPLEPEATKRLHNGPVVIRSMLQMEGPGEIAKFGGRASGYYAYTTYVEAASEIISKKETEDGRVEVEERRKFTISRDNIAVSKLDLGLALRETLPVDSISATIKSLGAIVTELGYPEFGAPITIDAEIVDQYIDLVDQNSLRGLFGTLNVDVPDNVESFVNQKVTEYAQGKIKDVSVVIQSIEGKEFVIHYVQEASGKPLKISYKNANGGAISAAEEEILRQANVFLDSQIVPNTETCQEGDEWPVYADEVASTLYTYAGDGIYDGSIIVRRGNNDENNNWQIRFKETFLKYTSEDGRKTAKAEVLGGEGTIDKDDYYVRNLSVSSKGRVQLSEDRHFLFFKFVNRITGEATARVSIATEPLRTK